MAANGPWLRRPEQVGGLQRRGRGRALGVGLDAVEVHHAACTKAALPSRPLNLLGITLPILDVQNNINNRCGRLED